MQKPVSTLSTTGYSLYVVPDVKGICYNLGHKKSPCLSAWTNKFNNSEDILTHGFKIR